MRKILLTNLVWIVLLGLVLPGNINAQTLKHAYTFEDGTANDTVGTLNGTLVGDSISIADGMCTVKGATNNTHGYMTLDAAELALYTYSAVTLEAYLKTTAGANGNNYTMLAYFGNNTGGNKTLWIQPTRKNSTQSRIETNNGSATKTAYLDGTELDDGKLHHLVAVLSGKALKYYLDGDLVAETATDTATNGKFVSKLDTVIANIFKGPSGWGDPNYNVSLDEFNIYDGELSAETAFSHAEAFVGPTNASLSNITSSAGTLIPAFSSTTKSYYVSRATGATSVNIDATAKFSGTTITGDGDIAITGTIDTVEIMGVSEDLSDTTTYTVYIMEEKNTDCNTPVYNPKAISNLVADPECTDLSLWNGWGARSIYYNADSAYCGISCAKLEASDRGCKAALDKSGFAWKANTTYRLNVMVKTIGGSIGFLAKGSANIIEFGVDTKGEWKLVDTTFTTGTNPGTNFYSFNTCDGGSNCLIAYIDNYQLYEVSNNATLDDITVSVGELNKTFSPSDTTYSVIVPTGTDTVFVYPVPTIDSAYVVAVDTVIMENGEGTSEILVTSYDSSATKTYSVDIAYETVFLPEVGQEYNIVQKVSGLVLGAASGNAQVVNPWETSPAQRLQIVKSKVSGEYFIMANNKTTFLYRLTTNTWSMGFTSDTTGLTANCRWKFVVGNEDTIYIQNPATGKFVASDNVTDGSGVYHDKAMNNGKGVWNIVAIPKVFIPADTVYSLVQKISGLALGNDAGGAKVLTVDENDVDQRLHFVESDVAGVFYILSNDKSSFMYRLTTNTWSMGFIDDTTGLSANCGWKIVLGNDDTLYIQNAVSGKYVASDAITSGSGVYHDKAMNNANGVFTIKILAARVLSDDATLSDLQVDGTQVDGFDAATTSYDVELPAGTTAVPPVTATTTDSKASPVITDASALPGATTIVVTAENGTATETYTINFSVAIGIDNISNINVEIFPNPADNVLNILNAENSTVVIMNALGKQVISQEINQAKSMINIEGLESGIYFIRIEKDNTSSVKRFVKN